MRRSPLLVEEARIPKPTGLPPFGPMLFGSVRAGVVVTSGISNTTGAWTEIIASTPEDANWIVYNYGSAFISGQNIGQLADIGIGAAGAEQVIVPSISCGQLASTFQQTYLIPVFVPRGSRVAVRITSLHSVATNGAVFMSLIGRNRQLPQQQSPSSLVALGANVANSQGVIVNVNNAWFQVVDATPQPFRALLMTWGASDTQLNAGSVTPTLAIGAAGNEQALTQFYTSTASTESITVRMSQPPVERHIPAGTRVAVWTGSSAFNYQMSIVVHGVPY